MVNEEIDFIVANFKSLLGIGHEASLKLECKLGEVWMNLSCKVGRNEPPLTVPAPKCDVNVSRKNHRSPSYFRRQARRRSARESQTASEDNVSLYSPITENVKEETMADEALEKATSVESDILVEDDKAVVAENTDGATEESVGNTVYIPVVGKDDHSEADKPTCKLKETQQNVSSNQVTHATEKYPLLFDDDSRMYPASQFCSGREISRFDQNLSAIENLRNLTASIEAIGSHYYHNVS